METAYIAKAADLISVADAIREKSETTEQLVFPSGFVTAIQGIKGGGDLNFEVVGGTTQPSSPKENTIWIETETVIPWWSFDLNEPSNPTEGAIWIETREDSQIKFNALKDNSVIVTPASVYQYIAGKWENATAKISQSGEWVDFVIRRYLFKSGVGLVDNYKATINNGGYGSTVINTEYIQWSDRTDVGAAMHFLPVVYFEKNKYKTLFFEIQCTGRYGTTNTVQIGVGQTPTSGYGTNGYGSFDASKSGIYGTVREIYPVDVSGMEGDKYIKMGAFGVTGRIYNVWLE